MPMDDIICEECGTNVSRGPICLVCADGGRCCPCVHDDPTPTITEESMRWLSQ